MYHLKNLAKLLALVSILIACSSNPKTPEPLPFQTAITALAHDLLSQINNYQEATDDNDQRNVVLDPFLDGSSGETIKASRLIEQIILAEGERNFQDLVLTRVTQNHLKTAKYLMNGVILYEDLKGSNQKYYHVISSVVAVHTGKIVANANVWIAETTLDTETLIGSPMLNTDTYLDNLVVTAKLPQGTQVDVIYLNSLDTRALLAEAETAYEQHDYETARFLFSKATERHTGQIMRTYAGLYRTNLHLGNKAGAEEAFSKLVIVAVRSNHLSARFLFSVNSTEFIKDPNLRTEYAMWLRQIGKYFSQSNLCLQIIGHASRTGEETYNKKLSQQRAEAIQKLLQTDFPQVMQKSQAYGEGSSQCKICSGSDDSKDTVDRRVEFKVMNCSNLI